MQNIHDIIEIKRGLHRLCGKNLVDAVAELDKCEEFFKDIFIIYGLIYSTETIRQKRTFIATATKYFILDRLPKDTLYFNDEKYESNNKKELKILLDNTIDIFYRIRNRCNSNEEFKKKYAEHFNEEVKDFSKEIAENRDDCLSDFAKTIQKIYTNSKNQKNKH